MAKTGSIAISEQKRDIANNKTYIKIVGKITTSGESWRGDSNTGIITVTQDGTKIHSETFKHGAPANSTTTLFTIYLWVTHDSKGESGAIKVSYNYDDGWCTASASKTLTDIPRQATITSAPNFDDEDNPILKYSNPAGSSVTTLQACIASSDGSTIYVPYRNIGKTGTSYTFTLTDAERKALLKATTGKNTLAVKFYVKTIIDGVSYYNSMQKTFTVVNAKPTLDPSVVDVNELTIALTGDETILVRNFSNAKVASGAKVYKEATIKSQKVICGSKSLSSGAGTIPNVGSGAFIFSVTDNRGNPVSKTVNVPLVEYVNLTCDLKASPPDGNGDMNFSVSGNYFAGNFGNVDNTIEVYYRYKTGSGEYGEWTKIEEVSTNENDNTYLAGVSLSGLDYQAKYTFQARAIDKLITKESVERTVKAVPVFDWGEEDFNFNVPVTIQGKDVGELLRKINAVFGTQYSLAVDFEAGSGWTINSKSCYLVGTNLRFAFNATRSSATGVGNIANEVIGRFTVRHAGRITRIYSVSFTNSTEGGTCSLAVTDTDITETEASFNIKLCGTSVATTNVNAYFVIPVTLDLDAY